MCVVGNDAAERGRCGGGEGLGRAWLLDTTESISFVLSLFARVESPGRADCLPSCTSRAPSRTELARFRLSTPSLSL